MNTPLISTLSSKNITLIRDGISAFGWSVTGFARTISYIEEQLTIQDINSIFLFLKWVSELSREKANSLGFNSDKTWALAYEAFVAETKEKELGSEVYWNQIERING